MPKPVNLTDDQIAWLRENHTLFTYSELSVLVDCCVDTLKRILVRHDIIELPGAKFAKPRPPVQQWTRPCMRCGDRSPRPKWSYFCGPCHSTISGIT